MPKSILKFSTNWNGKLSCGNFTTLRLYNPNKYRFGIVFEVYLQGEYLGEAQLIGTRKTLLSNLNEFVARLDTGYALPQTKSIIERMYGHGKDHALGLYLFTWVKRQPNTSVDLKSLNRRIKELQNPEADKKELF